MRTHSLISLALSGGIARADMQRLADAAYRQIGR
jgi:hypothetical protein